MNSLEGSPYFEDLVPLTSFFGVLFQMKEIRDELESVLGDEDVESMIKNYLEDALAQDLMDKVENVLMDFVNNSSEVVAELEGTGDYGEFPISIMNFGPVFWIQAQEFDDIQYFRSKEDVISCAEWEYQAFMIDEDNHDGEDDLEEEVE